MALFTRNAGVFAFQNVSRELVVELLLRRLPVNQVEVFAIVIQVAPHTVFAVGVRHSEARVIAVVQRQSLRYFFVALEALKSRRVGSELMATRALCGPTQRLVSIRKWARRNLCASKCRGEKSCKEEEENAAKHRRSLLSAAVPSDSRLAEDQDILRGGAAKRLLRAWSSKNSTAENELGALSRNLCLF